MDMGVKMDEWRLPVWRLLKRPWAWDCQYHAAEFAQDLLPGDLLPGLEGDTLAAAKVIKNGTQKLIMVWRQLQGLLGGIDKPTEENFRHAPATVALEEFLWEGFRGQMPSSIAWNRIRQVIWRQRAFREAGNWG
jgi:hypothetical protein